MIKLYISTEVSLSINKKLKDLRQFLNKKLPENAASGEKRNTQYLKKA